MVLLPLTIRVNKWQKVNTSIFPSTNCTDLVPFSTNLGSTLGLNRFTKFIRDCTYLDRQSLGVFIGILLGDANFNGRRGTRNIRISFKQSIINFPYMWQVFTMLSHYCPSVPRFECTKLGDKLHGRLVFETRHYPILNQLHDLFIINKVKVIKPDLFHYLTPLALAHWIMCLALPRSI